MRLLCKVPVGKCYCVRTLSNDIEKADIEKVENTKIVYKLPDVLQRIEDISTDRINSMRLSLEAKFDGKFSALEGKFDGKFTALEGKFSGLEAKVDCINTALEGKFSGLEKNLEGKMSGYSWVQSFKNGLFLLFSGVFLKIFWDSFLKQFLQKMYNRYFETTEPQTVANQPVLAELVKLEKKSDNFNGGKKDSEY
ncbi:hypothetical protein ACQ4LE_011037 [Meloidogyne hapla]|uniref:Uncharacterized protein n=1 Tax=Meloidogyne hapla TaxID=6305 RepID=A0A1I8BGY0_MELHA